MFRRSRTIYPIAALILLGLASCLKTVTNNNSSNPSSIAFINMAPYAPAFTVILDGSTVGDSSTFPYAAYKKNDTTGGLYYYPLFAGIHSISFQTPQDSILVSGLIQFTKNVKYSVYLYDTLNANGLNAVQLQDSYDSIPYGQCLYRFLNFSPTAPPLDVYISTATAIDTLPIRSSQAYIGTNLSSTATLSQYLVLPPGTYKFQFDTAGTQSMIDTVTVTLSSAKAYTMFVTGMQDSTGVKSFRKGVIQMN
jgi:hypothetical protein